MTRKQLDIMNTQFNKPNNDDNCESNPLNVQKDQLEIVHEIAYHMKLSIFKLYLVDPLENMLEKK